MTHLFELSTTSTWLLLPCPSSVERNPLSQGFLWILSLVFYMIWGRDLNYHNWNYHQNYHHLKYHHPGHPETGRLSTCTQSASDYKLPALPWMSKTGLFTLPFSFLNTKTQLSLKICDNLILMRPFSTLTLSQDSLKSICKISKKISLYIYKLPNQFGWCCIVVVF